MKGYRTILVGLVLAIAPSALTYLLAVDWNAIVGAKGAFAIAGVLTIAMRLITNTPVGGGAAKLAIVGLAWICAPVLSMLMPGHARAADVAVKAAAAAPATALPTGFYIFGDGSGGVLRPNGALSALAPAGIGANVGGGYTFINNGLVAGIEVSGGWENIRGSATCVLASCTSGNTFEGDVSARVGMSFAAFNTALGNSSAFTGLNGKLPVALAPITALNAAVFFGKVGVAVEHLKVAVNGTNASQDDLGLLVGGGVELPLTTNLYWRNEVDWIKFNDALCGGCALPTGRPSEWKVRSGLSWHF